MEIHGREERLPAGPEQNRLRQMVSVKLWSGPSAVGVGVGAVVAMVSEALVLVQGAVCSGEPAHVHEAVPGVPEQNRADRSGQRQERPDGVQGGQSVLSAQPRRDDPEG